MIASFYGYRDIAEKPIKNKADVNTNTHSQNEIFEYTQTPMSYAVDTDLADSVKMLIENGSRCHIQRF